MGAPSADEWNRLIRVYAVCGLFLFVKYLVTLLYAADASAHPEGKTSTVTLRTSFKKSYTVFC
jgi:hypothetical protein